MKKLLSRGRVVVTYISVFAILAVSILSVFTGVNLVSFAENEAEGTEAVVFYPLNGDYDADVVFVEDDTTGSAAQKTVTSEFTGYDSDSFWMTGEGNGTARTPFVIKTANQLAAVLLGSLVYDTTITPTVDISKYSFNDIGGVQYLDTTGLYFKVADDVKAFYMNGGKTVADMASTADVKAWFESNTPSYESKLVNSFGGNFDGNGVTVYGVYSKGGDGGNSYAGMFARTKGFVNIKNVTLANSYITSGHTQSGIGGLVGATTHQGDSASSDGIEFNNVAVINSYVANIGTGSYGCDAGALVGIAYDKDYVKVNNCLVYGNEVSSKNTSNVGLIGCYSAGAEVTKFQNIVAIGTAPWAIGAGWNVCHINNGVFENIYTDQSLQELFDYSPPHNNANNAKKYNIVELTADEINDSAAQDNMPALDWENSWQVNEGSYPTPKSISIREYNVGEAWSGEVAPQYAGGSGNKNAPYIINTAEQLVLMLTTAQAGEYYKLGADININNTTAENWTDTAKQWFTSNDVPAFEASFDGAGYTVSGIYYSGNQAGESAGLIPVLGSGANVSNVKIANSLLAGKAGSALGAVAGSVADNCAKMINISAVTVADTVGFGANAAKGGVIGKIGYSAVNLNDCISLSGGLFCSVEGQANVNRCVSVGAYPFKSTEYVTAKNVYTDIAGDELEGVTVVANADMIGEAAATAMAGLDFPNSWATTADSYPTPTGTGAANGVKGAAWTGNIATDYAGGSGSAADPYQIETAEQLAKCVKENTTGEHFILTADIYINDVNGRLWDSKIGCNEWYSSKTDGTDSGAKWYALDQGSFDGDGYVIYGLYYNRDNATEGYFCGLFPTLGAGVVKNVGFSEAYVACSYTDYDNVKDHAGIITGMVIDWDEETEQDSQIGEPNFPITGTEEYQAKMPLITNCFADHTCYVAGSRVGGLMGGAQDPFRLENCIFTGSLCGSKEEKTAGFIGDDYSYGAYVRNCVSFPQTCDRPLGGAANGYWRAEEANWVTVAEDVYFFSMYRQYNTVTRIANPEQRIGTAARDAMPGLDWAGITEDGAEDIWRVVEGGTPMLTIFDKHRDDADKFSDKNFNAPDVTVNFITGTSEVEVDSISGPMYSKMALPTIERAGYEFTGWYVFSDFSVEYPYDYFPPKTLNLYAGWEPLGLIQDFEAYPDTIWDYDDTRWTFNKPGAKGGYKNAYVRNGSKSMHLLDTSSETADLLLNYEDMLKVGQAYTITFWVATDKENNPATRLSLIHNSKPIYLDTGIVAEDMAIATGLKVGEWVQYSYSFTALTKWVSIRATGNSSLYFDDIIIAPINGTLSGGNIILLGSNGTLSPNTGNTVSVAALISAIMVCAVVAVISRKNLTEIIE